MIGAMSREMLNSLSDNDLTAMYDAMVEILIVFRDSRHTN